MNAKILIAALVTAVAGFFLGWLIYEALGADAWMKANMVHAPDEYGMLFKKQMNFFTLIAANLCWGLMLAWFLDKIGARTMTSAILPSVILAVLIAVTYDLYFYTFMNMHRIRAYGVDVLIAGVMAAIQGAVAGQVLGMGAKSNT